MEHYGQREHKKIISELQKEPKEGSFSGTFSSISDGAIEQLQKGGFLVNKRYRGVRSSSTSYYEVRFSKGSRTKDFIVERCRKIDHPIV